MLESWCWPAAATTSCDHELDCQPLLNGGALTPRYLRTQWDEKAAREFGPWRIAPGDASAAQTEPAVGLTPPAFEASVTETPVLPAVSADVVETAEARLSEEALNLLREEAYQRGLHAGREEMQQAQESEQQRARNFCATWASNCAVCSRIPSVCTSPSSVWPYM